MSGEGLLSHTRSLLWRAWANSQEEIASEAAATLLGLGMLVPEGGAAELTRLRLLFNAAPAELSVAQTEALADAGDRALNDYYHERACACDLWPESCHTDPSYAKGFWDTDAFSIGMAAVVGLWEAFRASADAAELGRLRAERHATNAALDDVQVENERLRARLAAETCMCPGPVLSCMGCDACLVCHTHQRAEAERAGLVPVVPVAVAELEAAAESGPCLPWAAHLDADDLEGLLEELSNCAEGYADLEALARVEAVLAQWRPTGELAMKARASKGGAK